MVSSPQQRCDGGLGFRVSTVTQVDRGSTFALRRSTLDFCLGGQRSCQGVVVQAVGIVSSARMRSLSSAVSGLGVQDATCPCL